MNFARRRTRFSFLTLLILTVAFVAGTGGRFDVSAAGPGPINPGFEGGATGWTLAGPDAALVVGSEGPAQFAAYGSAPFGPNLIVAPNSGTKMVRLGTPRNGNSSQPRGANYAKQTFTPSSSTFQFAARLFSTEFRSLTDYVCFSFTTDTGRGGANNREADMESEADIESGVDTQSESDTENEVNIEDHSRGDGDRDYDGGWCGGLGYYSRGVGTFSPFSFKKNPTSPVVNCPGWNPCFRSIDVGGNRDFLDSGWVVVTVTGLPTDKPVTFSASVGGTRNNAQPSWLYLDDVNASPPVASFDYGYTRVSLAGGVPDVITPTSGVGPLEGSPIQLRDLSTDPDPGDKAVAWKWTITGLDGPLTTQNPFFVPDHDGDFVVTLEVTDTGGKTSSKTTTIQVLNAPPLVNALNVEALVGKPFPVTGRFTDAGWNDTHTAAWGGVAPTSALLEEDHAPALGTGRASAIAPAVGAGSTTASLSITDSNGDTKMDPFTINTLTDTSSLDDYQGFNSSRQVTVDGSWLGLIPQPGLRSVYEIKWPGTTGAPSQDIPGGAEVLVNLKDLPADYDLVLVTVPAGAPPSAGYAFSGFAFSGYAFSELPNIVSPYAAGYAFSGTGTAGYAFSGVQRAAYGEAGYAFSGEEAAGYAFSGYAFSGYAFSGYAFSDAGTANAFAPYAVAGYAFSPISQMGFTGLQQSNTSPSDVALSELGLGNIPAGASVVGYSANSGTDGETVLARIDQKGTKLYAIIVGANGASSPETFRLDVEGSMTITTAALNAGGGDVKDVLNGGTCAPRFTGTTAFAPFAGNSLVLPKASATTLFVTQQERLQGLNPGTTTSWNSFVTDVQTLANRSDVNGKIISIPGATYSAWDTTPCSIDEANAVSDAVRDAIQLEIAANPTIQYVVFLGDDDVIPFRRVPDQVSIGNERSYLTSSFLKQGTPLYASVAGGYNLTDDCNVDANPTPWQGRELCIPDRVVARMVETPAEMAGQARAFNTANGLLSPMTAANPNLVTGYDFFADGSQAVVLALQGLNSIFSLVNETWTATDLRCKLLGQGAGCTVPVIADANAHYTHYAALSANGFNTGDYDDVLTSTNVQNAANVGTLVGRLFFTIGCHSGFSAPDNAIADIDPALGLDGKLDFPQAFAQARAVWVGSTGYGIGDDSGISGTEGLLVNYSKELAKGKTAGKALVAAKRSYLAALPAASVYDEKSSINLTLYGLPMYSLAGVASSPLMAAVEELSSTLGSPASFPVALNSVAQGSYYSAVNGDAAAPPYRPLQPRQAIPVGNAGLDPVHGILWTSGGFTDYLDFNPVISRPTVEWELDPSEPQVCYDNFWPSEIFRVNTLDGPSGPEQTVVVTPGQFRCDGLVSGQVRGTQRIFNILGWELLRSNSTDVTPPSLTNLEIGTAGGGLVLNIDALDPAVVGAPTSGVARFVVLRTGIANVTVLADQAVSPPVAGGSFSVAIPNPGDDRIVIQIIDNAGNVGYYTAKGPGIQILTVNLGPDTSAFVNTPVSFTANVLPLVGLSESASYSWDFGDGTTAVTSTNAVSHTFTGVFLRTVTVQVTTSTGGFGVDTKTVNVTSPVVDVDLGQARQELLNTSVSFTAVLSPALAPGVTAEYEWHFGDGSVATTSANTTAHTFGSTGLKNVTVQVLTSIGAMGDATVQIEVIVPAVIVNLGPDASAAVNTSVSFTATATITPPIVSPATVSFMWNFGDGTPVVTTPTNSTTHTFATPGPKTVTVQVTTAPTGGSGSDTMTVTVTNPGIILMATSIVCNSKTDLPVFPYDDITATTAAVFLSSHPNCHAASGWEFQWGPSSVSSVSGSTTGPVSNGWNSFTAGDSASGRIAYVSTGGTLWVREVLKEGYLPFSDSASTDSARLGCFTDAINYDNYDFIGGSVAGQTYYCVAWNYKLP